MGEMRPDASKNGQISRSTTVPAAQADGRRQRRPPVLPKRRKSAKIYVGSRVIQHANALVVGIDTLTQANQQLIIDLAIKHRLPAIYASREFVDAGGLVSYGVNYPDLYRRSATMVDKIFRGAKPADLPVEQPTKFEMVINQKTAKAIGLPIPQGILLRADEVIE
jgi:ABC-type uncharacterized transport system substrate-binding protein